MAQLRPKLLESLVLPDGLGGGATAVRCCATVLLPKRPPFQRSGTDRAQFSGTEQKLTH